MIKSFKKCDQKLIEVLKKDNFSSIEKVGNVNVECLIKLNGCTITIYKNKTIVFDGIKLSQILEKYGLINEEQKDIEITNDFFLESLGCDESGVGDFFGPLVIASAYYQKGLLEENLLLRIRDSKKIQKHEIQELYFLLKDKIVHNVEILNNFEYNKIIQKVKNMHIPKAILHNKSILKMGEKIDLMNSKIIIDEFASKENYWKYLENKVEDYNKNLTMIPKGESEYISVAIASIFARYFFIREMERISDELGIQIPYGAGNEVKLLVQKIKKENKNAPNYIKMHFNDKIF